MKQHNRKLLIISFILILTEFSCYPQKKYLIDCITQPIDFTNNTFLFSAYFEDKYRFFTFNKNDNSIDNVYKDLYDVIEPQYTKSTNKITFVKGSNEQGNSHIFVMDIDGKNVKQLTSEDMYYRTPFFSPDGNRIYFTEHSNKNAQLIFYRIDITGKNIKKISNNFFYVADQPRITKNEKYIYFTDGKYEQQIVRLDIETGNFIVISNEGKTFNAIDISENENRIYIIKINYLPSEEQDKTMMNGLYSISMDGKDRKHIINRVAFCTFIKNNNGKILTNSINNGFIEEDILGKNKKEYDFDISFKKFVQKK